MSTVTVENLELSQIVPSTTNPRKSFDQVALEQLAESIKEIGVTVPILVRQIPYNVDDGSDIRYELVSGHRRLRAAAIAELDTIPALIRELSDAEALDIQMVENLQRADLHPMDEAAGYQALIDAAADRGVALTQEELAHKVGKPLSYVAQRVKLLDATPIVQQTFAGGLINIGHALVLARLQPEMQEKGLRQVFDPNGHRGKDKTTEELIEHLLKQTRPDPEYPLDAEENQDLVSIDTLAAPVSRLKRWVEEKVTLSLAGAPWNLADERLYEESGSCIKCPKRTGSNPALFAEMTTAHDSCTDPDCFAQKKKLFVSIMIRAAEQQGEPLPKLVPTYSNAKLTGEEKVFKKGQWVEVFVEGECPDTKKGLMTKGEEAGSLISVCCNQRCKIHKHQVDRTQSLAASKDRTPAYGTPAYKAHEKEQERKKKLYVDRETPIREAVFAAIKANLPEDFNFTVELLADNIARNSVVLLRRWNVPGADKLPKNWWAAEKAAEPLLSKYLYTLTPRELQVAIFESMALGSIEVNDHRMSEANKDREDILGLAKRFKVDFAAIEKKVKKANPALYEDPPAADEVATSANTPKKAAKPTGKAAAANDRDFDDDMESDEESGTCSECGESLGNCECSPSEGMRALADEDEDDE